MPRSVAAALFRGGIFGWEGRVEPVHGCDDAFGQEDLSRRGCPTEGLGERLILGIGELLEHVGDGVSKLGRTTDPETPSAPATTPAANWTVRPAGGSAGDRIGASGTGIG